MLLLNQQLFVYPYDLPRYIGVVRIIELDFGSGRPEVAIVTMPGLVLLRSNKRNKWDQR